MPEARGIKFDMRMKWIINIVVPLLLLFIPTNEAFTPEIRTFCAVTVLVILMWALETVPIYIASVLLPVLYLLLNLAPAATVFTPWTNYIPWATMTAAILTSACDDTGVIKRLAYRCIMLFGGSYRSLLFGIMVAGVVTSFIVTDQVARVFFFAALCLSICKALNLEKDGVASSGIMIAAAFSALAPTYINVVSCLIPYGVVNGFEPAQAAGIHLAMNYVKYIVKIGPVALVWCFVAIFILMFLFRPKEAIQGKEFFASELAKMGKMSKEEIKAIVLLLVLLVAILTSEYHGIGIGWLFPLAMVAAYLPGVNLGKAEHVTKFNFSLIFMITGAMAIGFVGASLGAASLVVNTLSPVMTGNGSVVFLVMVWLMIVILNFVMTPLAMQAALTGPVVMMGHSIDIDPMITVFFFQNGCEQIILPYEYVLVLIVFGFGYMSMKSLMKAFACKMVVNIIFLVAIAIPFFKLTGAL